MICEHCARDDHAMCNALVETDGQTHDCQCDQHEPNPEPCESCAPYGGCI